MSSDLQEEVLLCEALVRFCGRSYVEFRVIGQILNLQGPVKTQQFDTEQTRTFRYRKDLKEICKNVESPA